LYASYRSISVRYNRAVQEAAEGYYCRQAPRSRAANLGASWELHQPRPPCVCLCVLRSRLR
jgi:hypothetical protein